MSIRFEGVSKSFGSKHILKNVSFEVQKGEILFIIGKSGMGKSVTLKHIVGVLKPDAGRVFVDEKDVTRVNTVELTTLRRRCGMVFQHPALLDSLSVFENVAFGLKTPQFREALREPLSEADLHSRVLTKLQLVHLGPEIAHRFPTEISYGMQKRVSLARTLAPEPEYLLFDEPTTGLDPITTQAVNDLIKTLSDQLKVTSVVVSHDMACALKIADRILVLDQGQILAHGTVSEIKRSREPLIQAFLSETLATSMNDKSAAFLQVPS